MMYCYISYILLELVAVSYYNSSNVCLFVCLFLFSSQVLGPIFMKLGGWIKVEPRSVLEGFIFGKVKVTGVKGQITVFRYG